MACNPELQKTGKSNQDLQTKSDRKKRKISCIIIDEHPIYRIGLKYLLESEEQFEITADVATVHQLIDNKKRIKPDLAILNVSIEGNNSLESIKLLKDNFHQLHILVISIYDEKYMAKRVIRAGAHGYLMKEVMDNEVKTAMKDILAGKIYFSEFFRNYMLESFFNFNLEMDEQRIENFNDKEFEVFILIGKGFSMNQIAKKLNRTLSTIETYKRNIKQLMKFTKTSRLKEFAVHWVKKHHFYQ